MTVEGCSMGTSEQLHAFNAIGHFDIAGPNLKHLGDFYSSIFGWQVDTKGPGYALLKTPEGTPSGALIEDDDPSLTIGIVVTDFDEALQTAVSAGGKVLMPKTDNGWVIKAQVSDPAGNRITIIQG